MFNPQRTPFLLASLLLALTLVACNTNPPAPTLPANPAVLPTPTAAAPPTPALPGLTPTELSSPTAAASAAAASSTVTAGAPVATPTVAAQAAAPTLVPPAPTEQALAPEQNPPGDIPDTQAFVSYRSDAGGYTLDVPEGWGRSENGPDVSFVEKLDGLMVTITDTATAPTAATAGTAQVAALQQTGRAVQVTEVKDVALPGGPAVLLTYTSNSEPNSVTGKQVRLENNAYLFYRNGQLATVTVWAPLGADNVDQWQRIAQSFRWR